MAHGDDDESLTKVWVALPNHWATGSESLWAQSLGGDLHEVRNVPFHAYGLNFLDVIRAVSRGADQWPEAVAVVKPSGHRTLRVFFTDEVDDDDRAPLLGQLSSLGASLERATSSMFAIDVTRDGDYRAVCDQLWAWEKQGLLEYETCEARVAGSFDHDPDADGRGAT